MKKGKYNNYNGDSDLNDFIDDIDTSKIYEDAMKNDYENFINIDMQNIDTLREESRDSDSLSMENSRNKLQRESGSIDTKDEISTSMENGSVSGKIADFFRKLSKSFTTAGNSYIQISGNNLVYPVLFFIGTIIYLEFVIHLLNYRSIGMKIIYPVLFAVPIGFLMAFITGLFHQTVNCILVWLLTGITCFLFAVQLVYYYVFKVYFTFQSLGMAGDAVSEFGSEIVTAVRANIGGLILIFLPFLLLAFLLNRQFDYRRRNIKVQAVLLGASGIFHAAALVTLLLFGKGDYSPYDLYHNSRVLNMCGKQLGITTMTRIDIASITGRKNDLVLADTNNLDMSQVSMPSHAPSPVPAKSVSSDTTKSSPVSGPTKPPTPTPIDTSPNIMNIDFNALAEKETNKTIQQLHNYFASVTPTNKNKYTGIYQGYNLILITAEGFSPYAVNQEKTPTLYKLVHEGFVFNNFYTALWQTSTSDGEYVALTGLIPTGSRNMYNGRNNLWPFALGNQFDKLGVKSKAYHDHTYTYYQRNETHPNLGYIFKGKGNGLELEHPDIWPESDLEMINATVDEYINEDQFHVYYLTVSGHMNYSFAGNSMSYKNRDLVKDLPYSSDAQAYIACQLELDRALEQLIKKLEAAGVADHTVIALSADHYPYGWEKEKLDELAGHVIDPNFEIYRNHFILWCEGMKENVVIDKPCSSLDILPTLSNLFGLEYDSRLLMGQDILSDAPPLVILSNRSFITDQVMYNSETGEATLLTDKTLPEDYISNINKIVKNKFNVSKSILQEDYYRYVFGD